MPLMSNELRARTLVAIIGIPVALFAAFQGGWPFAALIAVVAALAAREFHNLVADGAGQPFGWLGIAAAILLVALAGRQPSFPLWADQAFVVLLLLGLASFAVAVFDRKVEGAFQSAASTVSGALYTGGTLSFAVFMRSLPDIQGTVPARPAEGFVLVLFPLLVTWAGDTAAYFAGKRFGRRRLAPHVSPGKTVEGAIAGLVGSVGVGFAMGPFLQSLDNFPVTPTVAALMGLCLGIAGQLGDLAESRLKREAGVKDSGRLLPGHGGMLDRFDALFFTIPLAYGLIVLNGLLP